MDCSPPGSVHRISQARTLERVAISFYRGPSRPRDWTHGFCHVASIADRIFTTEPPGKHSKSLNSTLIFSIPNLPISCFTSNLCNVFMEETMLFILIFYSLICCFLPSSIVFKDFFLMWTTFKVFIEFVKTLLLFCVYDFFGCKAGGVLSPWPGIELAHCIAKCIIN